MLIHPSAIVDPKAQLAADVEVGPYAIIHAGAIVGEGCIIEGHAIIGPHTRLGCRNRVCHHAIVGTDSQDRKYSGETAYVEVGDDNTFREFVTINRATGEGRVTRVGNSCLLLAHSHVAHNGTLGDGVILANCAELGGEVVVEDFATLGGLVGVHQFCRIGAYAYVGACSKVTQDILPYITADGHPARPHGLNLVGLKRRGFSPEAIAAIKAGYRALFAHGTHFDQAVDRLATEYGANPEVMRMIDFIRASTRKIARPRAKTPEIDDLGANE